jgi:hypothetical protein
MADVDSVEGSQEKKRMKICEWAADTWPVPITYRERPMPAVESSSESAADQVQEIGDAATAAPVP